MLVTQVLYGMATVWCVIGVGILMAHLGLFTGREQAMLSKMAFQVGLPCLMVTMMAKADVNRIFSTNVIVSALPVLTSIVLYLSIATFVFHRDPGHKVIGCFGSCYTNANNMGLPIAAYVLGDTSWVAPILLMQVMVLQPIGLTILDMLADTQDEGRRLLRNLTLPFRNPMTLGVLIGMAINLLHWTIPTLLNSPLVMLGNLAVPSMLMAFGISLRLDGGIKWGPELAETAVITTIKLVIQPATAIVFARLLKVDPVTTLAVAVMAGLPSAQNLFVFAMRHQQAVKLARDVLVLTTVLSLFSLTAVAAIVKIL